MLETVLPRHMYLLLISMPLQGLGSPRSLRCLFQKIGLSLSSGTLGLALSWATEGAQAEASFLSNFTEPSLVPTQVDPTPRRLEQGHPPFTRTKESAPHRAMGMSVEKEAGLQAAHSDVVNSVPEQLKWLIMQETITTGKP